MTLITKEEGEGVLLSVIKNKAGMIAQLIIPINNSNDED